MSRTTSRISRREMMAMTGLAAAGLPARAVWPAGGPRSPFRIAFFSDVHARTEWQTPRALELAVQAINAHEADLVIAGGDLITDGFQSAAETVEPRWGVYLEMHRALAPRVEAVIGNHDLVAAIPEDGSPPSADPRQRFRTAFSLDRTYRAVDAGGARIFLLDSIDIVGGGDPYQGRVDEAQLRWLSGELGRTDPATPIILATHLPLLTGFYQATRAATEPAPANRVVVNNREVLGLFEEHNLLLVLQGHLHVDEMLRWRGTTFITGGAVCGKWWRGTWHGTEAGYGVVTLRPDRVEWAYHGYGWQARRP